MTQDRASWHIKSEAVLTELVQLMDLSATEAQLLKALQGHAQRVSPAMTRAFYERLFRHDNTADYLRDASMERLHSMVQEWFHELFSGSYDAEYARKRLTIGQIHVRIGLPVRYPLAMLDVVLPFGERVALTSPHAETAVRAFRKVLALDVAIFNQAYEDNQLEHLSSMVGGERLARLLLSGKG
jgi:hypothetical protein